MTLHDILNNAKDDRRWIKDWREGMFSSTSRDAEGWPIEMHGVVSSWEEAMDQRDALAALALDMGEELRKHGSEYRDTHGDYISERRADALLARLDQLNETTKGEQ